MEKKERQKNNLEKIVKNKKGTHTNWYLINAKNKIVGRLSTQVAKLLMGKDKMDFVRYMDKGDAVVVINASKVAVTGNKESDKKYYRYSGYPGGLKETTLEKLRQRKPEYIIYHAVAGMLPKNKLGKSMIKKLHIYPKEVHPHEAQNPQELEIK